MARNRFATIVNEETSVTTQAPAGILARANAEGLTALSLAS